MLDAYLGIILSFFLANHFPSPGCYLMYDSSNPSWRNCRMEVNLETTSLGSSMRSQLQQHQGQAHPPPPPQVMAPFHRRPRMKEMGLSLPRRHSSLEPVIFHFIFPIPSYYVYSSVVPRLYIPLEISCELALLAFWTFLFLHHPAQFFSEVFLCLEIFFCFWSPLKRGHV